MDNVIRIKSLLSSVLITSAFLFSAPAGASGSAISDFSLLKVGCYVFTDKLEYTGTDEVLSGYPLQDAFMGKLVQKADCLLPHHLQISSVKSSKVKSSLRLDTIPLKSQCIIGNIKLLNSGHAQHEAQMYFRVYRQGKLNRSICGVTAPSFVHPKNSNYRIYEAFQDPHLKIAG
jgi:hypothetical protein